MRRSTVHFLPLALALPLLAGEAPAFHRSAPAPSRAAAAAAKLKAVKPAMVDGMPDTTVPAAVKPLLVEYKEGLIGDFLGLLRETDEETPGAAALKAKFLARLKSGGLEPDADWGEGSYGGKLAIEVSAPRTTPPKPAGQKSAAKAEGPKTVILSARFAIPCGTDALLAVYSRGSEGWVPVLRYTADPYAEVKDALGDFEYHLSPPDAHGNYFLVGAAISPWCTSSWHFLTLRAYRLYPGIRPASRVYDFSSDIWVNDEPNFHLTAGREGFSLKFFSWQPLNGELHHRTRVVTVRIDDKGAKRLAPVAESPQDFLAEWFELDWEDAKHGVDPAILAPMEALYKTRHGVKSPPEMTLTLAQRCPGVAPRWVLGLETPRGKAGAPDLFLTVVDTGKNLFQIKATADQQPADCPGGDAPNQISTAE